jgi:hypothetical protein
VERASFALAQLIDAVRDLLRPGTAMNITASFDEFHLDLRVDYRGSALQLPSDRPSTDVILADAAGCSPAICSGFMPTA